MQAIHQTQPILTYGTPLEQAKAAVILVHGRGATAQSMLELAHHFPTKDVAYLMPQAANNLWYPNSGFAPFAVNEPYLSSAMDTMTALIEHVNQAGIATDHLVIGGFSQGAVWTSEYMARHATRYGGGIFFSGSLLGPLDLVRDYYHGTLADTPIYIGGANQDSWVSEAQLHHAAETLRGLGGNVTLEVVASSQHTIRPHDIEHAKTIIDNLVS